MMKTNTMIMAAAISAGVAEGLKKRMEKGQQDFSETARQYATNVFKSYGDYWTNWKEDYMLGMSVNGLDCPTNGRVLLKKTVNGHDNFVVLVGEKHEETQGTPKQGPSAKTFVEAMKQSIQGDDKISKVAAIELPVLEAENAAQYLIADKNKNCGITFGLKLNCKVVQEFEAEKEDVVGDKPVVGSGAGRRDVFEENQDQLYKNTVKVSLEKKANLHLASINHTIFEENVQDAGLRIKGAEPAQAMMFGGDTVKRNRWAAQRLDTLATVEESEKNTVVVFSYGIMHLCESIGTSSVQTELTKRHGWTVVNGDYAMVQNVANHGDQQIGGYQQQQVGGYQPQFGGYQQKQFGGYPQQQFGGMTEEEAMQLAIKQSMMQNIGELQQQQFGVYQNKPQEFPEKDIEKVMSFAGLGKGEAVQLLKQNGGNVNNAINASFQS